MERCTRRRGKPRLCSRVETGLAPSPRAPKATQRIVMMLTAKGFCFPYDPSMTLFRDRYRVESPRLVDWDYSSSGWYFVTLCTRDKECSLAHSVNGEIVLSDAGVIAEIEMKAISIHYSNVIIDRYVVMPNHVHTIVVIDGRHLHSPGHGVFQPTQTHKPSISAVMGRYKAGVTRKVSLSRRPGFLLAVPLSRPHPAIKRFSQCGPGLYRSHS